MDLVMVSAPNPPGSSASISPPGAVLDMAPANVLQGAVRLQGLASSPTPDTQVRVAWAFMSVVPNKTIARQASKLILRIFSPPVLNSSFKCCPGFAKRGQKCLLRRANAGSSCSGGKPSENIIRTDFPPLLILRRC